MSGANGLFEDTRIRQGTMAGYTGHIQERLDYDESSGIPVRRSQIPGECFSQFPIRTT
jgi:hypothetical protein